MKSKVVYYILLLLDSENTVRIPGFGVLTRRVNPASLLEQGRSVLPPTATVDFTASGKNKGNLLARFIAYKSGISPENAAEHVEEFTNSVKTSIHQKGRVTVDHLGVFYLNEGNVFFTPDSDTANAAYWGLEVVHLPSKIIESIREPNDYLTGAGFTSQFQQEPVEHIQEHVSAELIAIAAAELEDNADNNQKSSQDVVVIGPEAKKRMRIPVLLPIFLVIFLAVTALAITQYNRRGAIYHPAATYNRAPIEDKPLIGNGNNESSTELNKTADESTDEISGNKSLPEIINDSALELLGHKQDSESVMNESKIELEDPIVSDAIADEDPSEVANEFEEKVIEESDVAFSSVDEAVIVQDGPEKLEDSDCFIIVGAFGVQSNVDRMIVRLTEMGYTPVTMPRNNLTQIGVPAPCGSAEAQRVLADLQQNVEAQAWIFNR